MNEMNSMAAISGTMTVGVPCGTNSEKKCRPCRQKPTIRTIEKLITASTPVMLKWLVVVNWCWPGNDAEREQPEQVRGQDEDEQREDVGHELLALGPDVHLDHVVDEAGQPFDRHLPAAGNELALHAHQHEARDQRERDQQPQRAVREADVVAADVQRNDAVPP